MTILERYLRLEAAAKRWHDAEADKDAALMRDTLLDLMHGLWLRLSQEERDWLNARMMGLPQKDGAP
jgi:hypothetical protein